MILEFVSDSKCSIITWQSCKSGIICTIITITSTLVVISYLIIGSFVFDELYGAGPTWNRCAIRARNNTPSHFNSYVPNCDIINKYEMSKYFVPSTNWKNVSFYSRDEEWIKQNGGKIAAYYLFHDETPKPIVIVVHGYRQCRRIEFALLPAGMLWHAGFNVLVIDLRNHGDSDFYKSQYPYLTFGSEEYKDILGAVDYTKQNLNYTKIGICGSSMGASTSLIAFAKEPSIDAAFVDSPACNVAETLISAVAKTINISEWIASLLHDAACAVQLFKSTKFGCSPFANDVLNVAFQIGERPIHFDHTKMDLMVPEWNTINCALAAKKSNAIVETHFEDSGIEVDRINACDNHLFGMITNMEGYRQRLTNFFVKYLY